MRLKIWNMCHWYGFLYALLPYGLLSTEVPFIYFFLFVLYSCRSLPYVRTEAIPEEEFPVSVLFKVSLSFPSV